MVRLSNQQTAEMARELGHTEVEIGETAASRRWYVRCSCGYGAPLADGRPTVTRATLTEAVRTGQHHLRSAVRVHLDTLRKNGSQIPPSLAARL